MIIVAKHALNKRHVFNICRYCYYKVEKLDLKNINNIESYLGYTSWHNSELLKNIDFKSLMYTFNKLKKSTHPLVETAKDIVKSNRDIYIYPGFLVLVLAKCSYPELYNSALIKIQQLSQAIDLINNAFILHNTLSDNRIISSNEKDMELCEKLSVLGGDLFFSYACKLLSLVQIPSVVETMSKSIMHLSINNCTYHSNSTSKIDGFISYINWRYTSLMENGFICANLILDNSNINSVLMKEFIQLFTQLYAIKTEINLLKYLTVKNGIAPIKNGHILCYYPENYLHDLILHELIDFHNLYLNIIKDYSYELFENPFKDFPISLLSLK